MGNTCDDDDDKGERLHFGSRPSVRGGRGSVRRGSAAPPAIPLRDLVEIDPGFQRVIAILAHGVARYVAASRDRDDVKH